MKQSLAMSSDNNATPSLSTNLTARLAAILARDSARMKILESVRDLQLRDCWVAAGFVRNAVWDVLHGRSKPTRLNDVDVVFFDPSAARDLEESLSQTLARRHPEIEVSVKNQAFMHLRNGDTPYESTCDAMRRWPETCTAVGVALAHDATLHVLAPFGLDDLFDLRIRPTDDSAKTRDLVTKRVNKKRWLELWPRIKVQFQ